MARWKVRAEDALNTIAAVGTAIYYRMIGRREPHALIDHYRNAAPLRLQLRVACAWWPSLVSAVHS